MGNLVPSDGRKKNLLDLIRTYKKTKKILQKKPAEMEQQLKQQLMQKNFMQISRKKKRKYSFFHLTIRKNSNNYKKTPSTIISKVAYTFQNDIQSSKNCTKAFYEKGKVYAQNQ